MELGWLHYMARDYGAAIQQALKTIDIEPYFSAADHILGLAYEQMGRYKEAITAFKKAHNGAAGNPISLAGLAHAYAMAGRKSEARKIVSDLRQRAKSGYVPWYVYSLLYFALGDSEQGFKWLEKACDERDPWLIWSLQDPRLDSVRADPRFLEVLNRVNFPG